MKCFMVAKCFPSSKGAKSSQHGFILAAVLWSLAIMFVIIGIFHNYVERKLSIGRQAKQQIAQRLDAYSTEQAALYLLSTSRVTLAGLSPKPLNTEQLFDESFSNAAPVGDEFRVDGSVYAGLNTALFSIQDTCGLISLNAENLKPLDHLLGFMGLGTAERDHLLASLHDYIDADDTLSLGGAERSDYRSKRMLLPTNDYLRTERELVRVMGWKEWMLSSKLGSPEDSFSIRRISMMSLNSMPATLLSSLMGLSQSQAEILWHERRTNPVRTVEDFALRTGNAFNIDEDAYRTLPCTELRLKIWNKGGSQAKVISLQLTPNGAYGPWLVDYEYSVEYTDNNKEPLAIRESGLFNYAMDSIR